MQHYSLQHEIDRVREEQMQLCIAKNSEAIGEDITENPLYNEITVYWDYLAKSCTHLPTVKFMLTEKTQKRFRAATPASQRVDFGLRWMVLALHNLDDLHGAFVSVLGNPDMAAMYAVADSFMWQCKKQLLEVVDKLRGRPVQCTYDILGDYSQWLRELKEEEEAQRRQMEERRERERIREELAKLGWAKDRNAKRNKSVGAKGRAGDGFDCGGDRELLLPYDKRKRSCKSIKGPILLSFEVELLNDGMAKERASRRKKENGGSQAAEKDKKAARKQLQAGSESESNDEVIVSSENTSELAKEKRFFDK